MTAISSLDRPKKHLVLFQCVSAGLNGSDLGSDESEIVLLLYLVIDLSVNKVGTLYKYHVCPSFLTSNCEPNSGNGNDAYDGVGATVITNGADENENNVPRLSDEVRNDFNITEDILKAAPQLQDALEAFHDEVASPILYNSFTLVTDGQLHIRQSLFPEAQRKGISLPSYYYTFHDLRKEFIAAQPDVPTVTSIEDMLSYLHFEPDEDHETATKSAYNMANILLKLVCDGGKFHDPDVVQVKLEQGLLSRKDNVDTNCCVRARGLPWQASDQDIAKFFVGLNIAKGGVALCLSSQGRRNGEAIILFENAAHRDMALNRHKHHIGNRYIEVYKATGEDFINVAGGNNKEAQQFLSRGGQVIIRMRGLPYDATPKQVTDFFSSGDEPCSVLDDVDGVLFVRKPDGRATGDAFVLFSDESDAEKALQKHKEVIGSRYIELFRSTTAEVQQVLNRTTDAHNHKHHYPNAATRNISFPPNNLVQIPLIPQLPESLPTAVIPQQLITAGTRKDCIRLRGLPYEAQVEHILEFLGDYAKNIVFQGVHMVYNAQGHPSGEAFIQMSSEQAAFSASQNRHHHYMGFGGKKQRYIEVFQCSGEDMNLVLTGSSNAATLASVAVLAAGGQVSGSKSSTVPPGGILPPPPGMLPLTSNPPPIASASTNVDLLNMAAAAAASANTNNLANVQQQNNFNPLLLGLQNFTIVGGLGLPPPPVGTIDFGALTNDGILKYPHLNPNTTQTLKGASPDMLNPLGSVAAAAAAAATPSNSNPFLLPGIQPGPPAGTFPPVSTSSSVAPVFLPPTVPTVSQAANLSCLNGFLLPTPQNSLLRLPSLGGGAASAQQQNALLQSQLAAQRLLLSQYSITAGANPNPSSLEHHPYAAAAVNNLRFQGVMPSASSGTIKRTFDDAFQTSTTGGGQHKRSTSYGYSTPTISAAPKAYSHNQQTAAARDA